MSQDAVLNCANLHKSYKQGPEQITVLSGVEFAISQAEMIAIVGASGSGKSTLLNMLGGLDLPSEGKVEVCGESFNDLSEAARGQLRHKNLGFVYQFHHLLGEFTALENVSMPLLLGDATVNQAAAKATELLNRVGLGQRLHHKPSELSGGERQRVAIARALVTQPKCVLMDEPTGNLDSHTANDIQNLMQELNQVLGISFIVVTHDMKFAEQMNVIYELDNGKLNRLGD